MSRGVENGRLVPDIYTVLLPCRFSALPPLSLTSRRDMCCRADGVLGHRRGELAFVPRISDELLSYFRAPHYPAITSYSLPDYRTLGAGNAATVLNDTETHRIQQWLSMSFCMTTVVLLAPRALASLLGSSLGFLPAKCKAVRESSRLCGSGGRSGCGATPACFHG